MMAMTARAFVGQDPFDVWGDGTQVRNWTHVEDIVSGTILARLDQTVRRRDRLVDAIRRRKQRIQDFTEAINPTLMASLGNFALNQAGRAFLRSGAKHMVPCEPALPGAAIGHCPRPAAG